jgi:predicted amino acid racemase
MKPDIYPAIVADLPKLRENANALLSACQEAGVALSMVTKAFCADADILRGLEDLPFHSLADARLQNLARIRSSKPKMLLRIGDPAQAQDIVNLAECSLQSEMATIKALARAAEELRRPHKIILMIDLGDLREGIFYQDRAGILSAAEAVSQAPWLELHGLGCNLSCFGGIVPDQENMGQLLAIAAWLRQTLDLPIPLVSGGNSSSLGLLFAGQLPKGINHLRVGEGLLLGMDTATGLPFPQLHQDTFTIKARLGEALKKPSQPIGQSGPNAFGERSSFPDTGPMRRGIGLIGRQDVDPQGLTALDPGIRILGASSDHLILDLDHTTKYRVGDLLSFRPNYSALLRAYTSPYVTRGYMD